mmetsp:Transcript_7936/g.13139  ORF Transcript_7936/g.13139 Transcript_7936/m.13139 type:complete len:481 (+) Transcript_7936:133-1575(+)
MVLTRRPARPLRDGLAENARYLDGKRFPKGNRAAFVAPLTILTVAIALMRIVVKPYYDTPTYPVMPASAVRLEEKVGLSLDWKNINGSKNITMGPHRVALTITKPCKEPRFVMRLVGDEALYAVPVVQIDKYRWKGSFEIPFPGNYLVEPRWYGCERSSTQDDDPKDYKGESMKITVTGKREKKRKSLTTSHTSLNLFPEGFWASPTLYGDMENKRLWITRQMGLEQPNFILSETEALGQSTVAKEATPIAREFGDLSNYELLCWVGSDSAATMWESFKSLRPSIAKHQKPFKFHYYPIDNFVQPDRDWDTENKLKFRKCKMIIISVDELRDPISQGEYKEQVATFLNHMVKMFDDDSFPIWMYTANLPPASSAEMCSSPKKRTQHHPCNDVLFDLFAAKPFPDRVQLLDNTDLTDPLIDEGLQDAFAIMAMRTFAICGDQVKKWRRSNQKGKKDGLERKGVLEPNVDYDVYNFNRRLRV